MSDDLSDIVAYYAEDPQREQDRLDRHQLEHELTWRYLDRYLPAQGSILEIGAATGRYTLALAQRGYQVTAVDMTAALLERCQQRLVDAGLAGPVRLVAADARALGEAVGRGFDAVLLMGPLYHLVVESDRRRSLGEAFDRLRAGGLIFSTFISRLGILGDLMRNVPHWIEDQALVQAIMHTGSRPVPAPAGGFRGYFARAAEIAPLHEALGFKTLVVAGVEPAISADDEAYNRLAGEQRRRWLDLLYAVSREPSIIDASRHLLYIGEKA